MAYIEEGIFIDEPEQYLALHVLKQALQANDTGSRERLSFWCEVAGITPEAFFDRVEKEGGTWRKSR